MSKTRILAVVFAAILLVSSTPYKARSEESRKEAIGQFVQDVKQDTSLCDSISDLLTARSTDTISELNSLIKKYTDMLVQADSEDRIKLLDLINTTQDLIISYTEYEASGQKGTYHPVYSAEVAAVIAYFSVMGYDLSAELLTHAKNNNQLDSYYTPVLGSDVTVSNVFTTIKNS